MLFAGSAIVLSVQACSSGDSSPVVRDAASDVDFWEVDVAPIDACRTERPLPYDGQECDAPGLKCVVPCTCFNKRGYKMYCSPTLHEWSGTTELCCGEI